MELGLDNDRKEVIAYGAFAIFQTLLSFGFTAIIGFTFGLFTETMIVAFIISILRKYSGGVHASSPGACVIVGAAIAVGIAAIVSFITSIIDLRYVIFLGLLAFSWSYYIIYKLAPVDSAAKPIKTSKKKERMRKASIRILHVYTTFALINILIYSQYNKLIFLSFSLCIYGGLVWQSFTLTHTGYVAIRKTDVFLNKILFFYKGGK